MSASIISHRLDAFGSYPRTFLALSARVRELAANMYVAIRGMPKPPNMPSSCYSGTDFGSSESMMPCLFRILPEALARSSWDASLEAAK